MLVTGAYGLLGSAVVAAALEQGGLLSLLSRESHPEGALEAAGLLGDCQEVRADVSDEDAVHRAFEEVGPDVVIHLAGVSLVGEAALSPRDAVISSVTGTVNILEEARQAGVGAVLVASSDKAYGASDVLPYTEEMPLRPKYPYEAAKAAADVIARSYWASYGLPVAVVRSANLYGPGDTNRSRLIPGTIAAVLAGESPEVRSDGSPERDYLYVSDAARAYLLLAEALLAGSGGGEPYNVGSGTAHTALEIVQQIIEIDGSDVEPAVRGSGVPEGEIGRQAIDSRKVTNLTGWAPQVGLRAGLAQTLDWYRSHPGSLGP